MYSDRHSEWHVLTTSGYLFEQSHPESAIQYQLEREHETRHGKRVESGQSNAWANSIKKTTELLALANLGEDIEVIFEAVLRNRQQMDITLCGKDLEGKDHVVIIEYKEWFWRPRGDCNRYTYKIKASETPQHVDVEFEEKTETRLNPLVQVMRYRDLVRDALKKSTSEPISVDACVYFPECPWIPNGWKDVLVSTAPKRLNCDPKYPNISEYIPVFSRKNKEHLASKLSNKLAGGEGAIVTDKLMNALLHEELAELKEDNFDELDL